MTQYPGPFKGGPVANFINGYFKHDYQVEVSKPDLTQAEASSLSKGTGLQLRKKLENYPDLETSVFEVTGTGRNALKFDNGFEPQKINVTSVGWE